MRINVHHRADQAMPLRVTRLIEELYRTCIDLCADIDIPVYFLNRSWGVLGEGSSLALYRQDFNRFLEIAKDKLDDDRYFLQDSSSDEFWPGPQARLRLHGTLMEDPVFGELAVHQGIYINLYPLDGLAKLQTVQQRQVNRYRKIQSELLASDYSEEKNWQRLLQKRKTLMESHSTGKGNWLIAYPMLPEDVTNCIISPDELISTGELSITLQADYADWLFDMADDIR